MNVSRYFRSSTVAMGALAVLLVATMACNEGEAREATDESYIAELCGVLGNVEGRIDERMAEIEGDGGGSEPEDLDEMFAQMFTFLAEISGAIADEMDDVTPPADLREYHDTVVEGLRLVADLFADPEGFENLGEEAFAPLKDFGLDDFPEIEERLRVAAEGLPECDGMFDEV